MGQAATTSESTRHRLFEGVLLRLARRPDVGEFILRGGMLLRHWLRPIPRPAGDLDFVATFPFDVEEAGQRFLRVLAEDGVEDGVAFDVERARVEGIFLETGSPGVRVYTSGVAGGIDLEFHADLTFAPHPRPAPVFEGISTECGLVARVRRCRPESVIGQKIQALRHLGVLAWRPKDLNDIRQILARVAVDPTDLGRAIGAYLADVGGTGADARALFGPESWWTLKRSSARWLDFATEARDQNVPRELGSVVAEVAGRLAPILEGLP
jgi:hypothetical protein